MSDNMPEIEDEIILPSQEFINRSKAKSEANKTSNKTPKNKGTGAGGENTNKNGLSFEDKTNNEKRLEKQGFIRKTIQGSKENAKTHFYLIKEISSTKRIIYLKKDGLKKYFKVVYNEVKICRSPDEAYLIINGDDITLKVLEKKTQNCKGSVEEKLMAGDGNRKQIQYSINNPKVKVAYAFCICEWLKENAYLGDKPKNKIYRRILQEWDIPVLFGDDKNYFEELDKWVYGEI